MSDKWRVIKKNYIYKSENPEDEISIRRDFVQPPSGDAFHYVFVDCPYEVVFCLGIDEKTRVLMIRQYRFLVDEWLWEIPAGSPKPGESLEQAALREFEEESGYTAKNISHVCSFYSSIGITNQKCHIYLATGIEQGTQSLSTGEQISKVQFFDKDVLNAMLIEGQIKNSGAVIGVLKYLFSTT